MRTLALSVATVLLVAGPLQARSITGQIRSDQDKPITKVKVTLHRAGAGRGSPEVAATETDSEGRFRFDFVKAGSYDLVVAKGGWAKVRQPVTLTDSDDAAERQINLQMQPSQLSKIIAVIHTGSLTYLAIFGLVILLVNFFIAPRPMKAITVAGWAMVAGSVVIALVKTQWAAAIILGISGGGIGALLQWQGQKRTVDDSLRQERKATELEKSRQRKHLEQLVGKRGRTFSDVKPHGHASIEGETVEVKAGRGFIAKDVDVVVSKIEAGIPVVDPVE